MRDLTGLGEGPITGAFSPSALSFSSQSLLTLAKSRDGSALTFPPSFSSAQMALPLCKHTQRNVSEEFVLRTSLFVSFVRRI